MNALLVVPTYIVNVSLEVSAAAAISNQHGRGRPYDWSCLNENTVQRVIHTMVSSEVFINN